MTGTRSPEPTVASDVWVSILGPVRVRVDGTALELGGRRQRAVLGLLAARHPEVVSVGSILEAVWGEQAVERDASNVHVYVSNLRRALRPAQGHVGIETVPPGYRLHVHPKLLDRAVFEEAVAAGLAEFDRGEAELARTILCRALALWQGELLADLESLDIDPHLATYLQGRRELANEARLEAEILTGRAKQVIPELESLTEAQPLRDNAWRLLMLALEAVGRRDDALRAYRRARSTFLSESGLEPGPILRGTERTVLRRGMEEAGPYLLCLDARGGLTHHSLTSHRTVLIGRDADADVTIDWDGKVSRAHAELRWDSGRWWLHDLDSTNGTTLNGQPLPAPSPVGPGDVIGVGAVHLTIGGVDATRDDHPSLRRSTERG